MKAKTAPAVRTRLFLLFLFLVFPHALSTAHAAAQDGLETVQREFVQEQLERLDTSSVENFWRELAEKYGGYLPGYESPSIMRLILGDEEGGFTFSGAVKGLIKFLFHELLVNGKLLGTIIIITVFAMILETMQTAFEKNTVSTVAYAIAYLVVIILAVNSFSIAISYAKDAISEMVHFMLALIPLVLALLASTGNVTSVAIFHPLIVFMVNVSGTFIYAVVFPLLFFSAVLSIVSTFSERYKVTQLANLLRNISIGLLGIFLTVFLGVVSVQGATSAITDGVTIRTAKYVTGNFVPVVGGMISDAADTVVGASLLVKNAVGLVGVSILLLICAFPAVKILSLALIYNFSSAVMQPLGNSPIIQCLSTIGKSLIFIFAALATVGLMFFLAITIIIAAGNLSVMVR
ncbi:stage III sporulation protein AE [Bacillaceae bacterium]